MTNLVEIYKCSHCLRTCRIRIEIPNDLESAKIFSEEKNVYCFNPQRSCVFFPLSGGGSNSNFELEMYYEE